jgi:hypothetical protein
MTAGPKADCLRIFLPDFDSMSAEDGLAYVEPTPRPLDPFHLLPTGANSPLDSAEAAAIARLCDELEASIRSHYRHAPF